MLNWIGINQSMQMREISRVVYKETPDNNNCFLTQKEYQCLKKEISGIQCEPYDSGVCSVTNRYANGKRWIRSLYETLQRDI